MKSLPFYSVGARCAIARGLQRHDCLRCRGRRYRHLFIDRPKPPPPADTADQIAPHESWCYETMGYPECYTQAQNTVEPNQVDQCRSGQ